MKITSAKDAVMYGLGRLVILIFDMILFSCRIEVKGLEEAGPYMKKRIYLLASWHGRLIVYFMGPRKDKPAAMASRSRDGYLASLLQETGGYVVFRGSSRRGGTVALAQMERYMGNERRCGMLSVDGPTGPRHVVKPGAARLASALRCPIIPMSFSARRFKSMRSWDRLMIPYPFTRGLLIFGKPVFVPFNPDDADLERVTAKVQDELLRITDEADRYFS
jgi:lysophospholipid acyltransferase (LPLAT)-like uncharacterized protein